MTGIKIDMTTHPCRVDWGTGVSALQRVAQNTAVNYRTDIGSDCVVARGNDLSDAVRGGALYDATSAQHAVNFAVLDTIATLRLQAEDAPEETIGSLSARVAGKANNRIVVNLFVTNAAGAGTVVATSAPV